MRGKKEGKINGENIPTYLKENAGWCNWKYEEHKGRKTKVPYNPKTGKHAAVNRLNTFADFDTAVSKLPNYDGIGIRVDGKVIAINLEHCLEEGKLKPWASDIVSHFLNTYIEISPSGSGLRILLLTKEGFTYPRQ